MEQASECDKIALFERLLNGHTELLCSMQALHHRLVPVLRVLFLMRQNHIALSCLTRVEQEHASFEILKGVGRNLER